MKNLIIAIVLVLLLGGAGILAANYLAEPDIPGTEIRTTEQVIDNPTSAPAAQENTFTIMTPEEKAAADAAREAAAQAATTTASSSDDSAQEDEGGDESVEKDES